MLVLIDRQSVAAGDDVVSHAFEHEVAPHRRVDELAVELVQHRYLPLISGGKACWIVRTQRGGQPLAVLSIVGDEINHLRFVARRPPKVVDVGASLFFDYRAQQDPAEVFATLAQ